MSTPNQLRPAFCTLVPGVFILVLFIFCLEASAQTNCQAPASGLISWWRAEGDGLDETGENDGVLNTVGFAAGKVGQAFSLSGFVCGIAITNPLELQLQDFTIETWVKRANGTRTTLDTTNGFLFGCSSGGYAFILTDDGHLQLSQVGAASVSSTMTLSDTTAFHHVAVSKSGSTVVFYLDGTPETAGPFAPGFAFSGPMTVGARGGDLGRAFFGLVDELAIYGRALTGTEIQAIYSASGAGKCTGPQPPSIIIQPTNQIVQVGGTVTFSVAAVGAAPLSYQWLAHGTNLPGATNTVLTLTNVQTSQAGLYSVLVTNSVGSIMSSNALLSVSIGPSCVGAPSGLLGWWPGEGNADDTLGQNNGTLVNGTGFGPGEVNQAFSFNGATQFVEIADSPALDPTSAMTLEAWVYLTAFSANDSVVIAAKEDPFSTRQYQLSLFNVQGQWRFGTALMVPAGFVSFTGSTPAQLGTWYHVAMSYDGAALRLYVNGAMDASAAVNGPINVTANSLKIGSDGTGPWNFIGLIDEVSLYNRALTAPEIASIAQAGAAGKCISPPVIVLQPADETVPLGGTAAFSVAATGALPLSYQWRLQGLDLPGASNATLVLTNVQQSQAGLYSVLVTNLGGAILSSNALLTIGQASVCTRPPNGLIAWWSAEGNANDNAGTNNGTLINGPTYDSGEVGQAFRFVGTQNQRVYIPDSPIFQLTNSLSIEGWFKINGGWVLVHRGDNRPGLDPFALSMQPDLTLVFQITDANANTATAQTPGPIATGVWTHIAATLDGASGTMSIYLNGQLAAQTQTSVRPFGPLDPTQDPSVCIGNVSGKFIAFPFDGWADEVSLYSRALTQAEILNIYNAGSLGKCALAPFILIPPTNQTATLGNNVTFTVLAQGTPPLSYQWSLNGTNLVSATNTSLSLTDVQISDSGNYAVQVSNGGGSVSSSNALLTIISAPPCTPPPTNLISRWSAENNALDQVGGNNGTLTGSVSFASGKLGQAFHFDGASDAVVLGHPPSLQVQDLTIEAWVKRASAAAVSLSSGSNGMVLSYGAGGYGFGLLPDGTLFLTAVGGATIGAGVGITDTNFHYLAVSKSGSTVVFYVDAIAYVGAALNSSFTFATPAAIGAQGDNLDNSLLGDIDELAVYDRALSGLEVQSIYNAGPSGKCNVAVPPFFISQPSGQLVGAGRTVTLTALAAGSIPLDYQWQFGGTNLPGATGSSLTLVNVQSSQAGNYSVRVTNSVGAIQSDNAVVSVVFIPAAVQVTGTNVPAGSTFAVPVQLVGNGNENALGFSLSFDPTTLACLGTTPGSSASNATFIVNTNSLANGRLGVALDLEPATTFAPGTQTVCWITFRAAVVPNINRFSSLVFVDQPTPRQLWDPRLVPLPVNFNSAVVAIQQATGFEGDVSPRPNGDQAITLGDWLQMGRYVSRQDYPTNAAQFQRADCAPRLSLGDGSIRVSDWVQTGRYLAGLDPLSPTGGPTNEIAVSGPGPSASRLLTMAGSSLQPGEPFTLDITLAAQGNENALGFSLNFDPISMSLQSASPGADATGATLFINTNQSNSGSLGFALALGSGISFSPGPKDLVHLVFMAAPSLPQSITPLFSDAPVPREIADALANALPASYLNSTVNISLPPSLAIQQTNQSLTLSWPSWASNFILQEANGGLPPNGNWSNLTVLPVINNDQSIVVLPITNRVDFFRLRHP